MREGSVLERVMPCLRSFVLFTAVASAASLACDSKEDGAKPGKKAAAKAEAKPAAEPAASQEPGPPTAEAADGPADGSVISETALCEHILAVAHEELGHLDEFDPEVETAAVQRCAKAAAGTRV